MKILDWLFGRKKKVTQKSTPIVFPLPGIAPARIPSTYNPNKVVPPKIVPRPSAPLSNTPVSSRKSTDSYNDPNIVTLPFYHASVTDTYTPTATEPPSSTSSSSSYSGGSSDSGSSDSGSSDCSCGCD